MPIHTHSVLVVARKDDGRGLATRIAAPDVRVTCSDSVETALERMTAWAPCLVLAVADDRDVGGMLLRTLMLEAPQLRSIPLAFLTREAGVMPGSGALHAPTLHLPVDLARVAELLARQCPHWKPPDAV